MVRDRMGIKPLYYYATADGVLFGSEPKAILANPLAARPWSASTGCASCSPSSRHRATPSGRACTRCEPGTVVTVDRERPARARVLALEAHEHTDDRDTTVAHVRELLDDIVARQLVADVPRCTLLSGGLDSSAMTALAARQLAEDGRDRPQLRRRLRRPGGELPRRRRCAATAGHAVRARRWPSTSAADHQDIVLDTAALADPAVAAHGHRGPGTCPPGSATWTPRSTCCSRPIREHSTVALSGESADEVFGGYRWFHDPEAQQADTFPWLACRFAGTSATTATCLRRDLRRGSTWPRYIRRPATPGASPRSRGSDGESDFERRMREVCYLHLTRFVQHPAGPQGPDEHGRRPGGAGAVLRPPAGASTSSTPRGR